MYMYNCFIDSTYLKILNYFFDYRGLPPFAHYVTCSYLQVWFCVCKQIIYVTIKMLLSNMANYILIQWLIVAINTFFSLKISSLYSKVFLLLSIWSLQVFRRKIESEWERKILRKFTRISFIKKLILLK